MKVNDFNRKINRFNVFQTYSRVPNKHKSILNFHVKILIYFYINLGIAVIFFFFFINIFKKNLIYKYT